MMAALTAVSGDVAGGILRQIAHLGIEQGGASLSYANSKAHDRVAVDAGHALNSADAGTFSEGRDYGDLLIRVEYVCHTLSWCI